MQHVIQSRCFYLRLLEFAFSDISLACLTFTVLHLDHSWLKRSSTALTHPSVLTGVGNATVHVRKDFVASEGAVRHLIICLKWSVGAENYEFKNKIKKICGCRVTKKWVYQPLQATLDCTSIILKLPTKLSPIDLHCRRQVWQETHEMKNITSAASILLLFLKRSIMSPAVLK